MRHKKEKLLQDALKVCEELKYFTAGKTYEEVKLDRGLQLILERLFDEARLRVDGYSPARGERIGCPLGK